MRIVIKPIETWQARKALANVAKKNSSDQVSEPAYETDDNLLSEIVDRPDLKLD